jgi:hypothetical protein
MKLSMCRMSEILNVSSGSTQWHCALKLKGQLGAANRVKDKFRTNYHPSRTALVPTQPPILRVAGLFLGGNADEAWRWPFTPILLRGWRKSGAIHLLPLWDSVACSRETFIEQLITPYTAFCQFTSSVVQEKWSKGYSDYMVFSVPSDRCRTDCYLHTE